jgi:hypothetical protein
MPYEACKHARNGYEVGRTRSESQVNAWQLVGTRCQWAIVGSGEFKKLVYDSKFRKLAGGMGFVNSKREPGPRQNTTSALPQPERPKPHRFQELSEMLRYVIRLFRERQAVISTVALLATYHF